MINGGRTWAMYVPETTRIRKAKLAPLELKILVCLSNHIFLPKLHTKINKPIEEIKLAKKIRKFSHFLKIHIKMFVSYYKLKCLFLLIDCMIQYIKSLHDQYIKGFRID